MLNTRCPKLASFTRVLEEVAPDIAHLFKSDMFICFYTASPTYICVYMHTVKKGTIVYTLYVDYLHLLGGDMVPLEMLKKELISRSKRTRERPFGDQPRGLHRVQVERFGMRECKSLSTFVLGPELLLDQPERELLDKVEMLPSWT